jgi:hypothetical protein
VASGPEELIELQLSPEFDGASIGRMFAERGNVAADNLGRHGRPAALPDDLHHEWRSGLQLMVDHLDLRAAHRQVDECDDGTVFQTRMNPRKLVRWVSLMRAAVAFRENPDGRLRMEQCVVHGESSYRGHRGMHLQLSQSTSQLVLMKKTFIINYLDDLTDVRPMTHVHK